MKKAIVVGATSGIGREIARKLVEEGYKVGITGRRAEFLENLKDDSPENYVTSCFDAAVDDAADQLDKLIGELGGMDLFIFSSGTGHINAELDIELEQATNRLNVIGFTALVDTAYNYFRRSGGGQIAAITSVMGMRGSGHAPAYAATKAFQINYLESLRQRSFANKDNISVTDLRPGSVDTDMMKGDGHFWVSTPERAAECAIKAICKKKAVQYITPRWAVIGNLLKILPRAVYKRF